tara:strand:- start:10 stop:675 length:666 start_codon:yes stop_codon:yes gene_type:complete
MFKDIRYLWNLIKIQTKSGNYDTNFIVDFITHFNGDSLDKTVRVWAATKTGTRYMHGQSIFDYFSQYDDAKPNTFVGEYKVFMQKYKYGELQKFINLKRYNKKTDRHEAFGKFMLDVHDFTHVLTGYPPTPFGELARIEVYKQYEGRGWKILSRVGKARIFLNGLQEWKSRRPLYKEAEDIGKLAKNYMYMDWFNALGQDINQVRENLNTLPTTKYHWKDT